MASSGFDGGSSGNDIEQLARQYWNAWGQAMRGASAPAPAPVPNWNDAMGWWAQMAKTGGSPAPQADDAIDRLNAQASGWFAKMQQLAAQFAGQQQAAPADIASAWKQMLGAGGAQPFADLLGAMQGPGQSGVGQWMEQAAPFLRAMQADARGWLSMPAFGFTREHQERWQELARAQLDYQEQNNAYNALMAEAAQEAFRRFEQKLAQRMESGQQIGTARELFDLWIDAAEDAYAQIALSERFSQVYGELVNAQMRVRAGLQREVEQNCNLLGMPTRTEVDAAHRRIVQLERELRRLRDAMGEREAGPATRTVSSPSGPAGTRKAAKTAAKKTSTAKNRSAAPAARKSTKSTAGKSSAARKPKESRR